MPKFPIYEPILFDNAEICPHNKIAKTIKRVYHREPPIRLKDVCQMRKLGEHRLQLENECNNSNYLWHVTLNTGNNPYVSAKPKHDSNVHRAGAWNFHNLVFEKMRNGFRRYRAQTSAQKPCDARAVEWIMKPRDLAYDSSQECYMWTHTGRKKRARATQSTPPASTNCKKRTPYIESRVRRDKYSLSAHFEEALAKSKKNLENEKRRTVNERVEGGDEQRKTQVLRKSVIVKNKLADTLKKAVNTQQSVLDMKLALKKKKQVLKATKYIGHAQKTGRALQQQQVPPAPVPATVHKAPKLQLTTATSKNDRLRKISFRDFTHKLSDLSIWCPRKSSFKCFESLKHSTAFDKALSAEKVDKSIVILRRLTQAFKTPTKLTPTSKAAEPLTMLSTPKPLLSVCNKSEERVSKVTRVGVCKKKSLRHYRTFRRRVKHSRHVKDKHTKQQQHEDKAVQCINTKSNSSMLGSSSGSSVLLSESNKELGAWLGGHEGQLRLAHESRLLQKSGMITPKETEKSDSNNQCSDYTISFHTPITLRQLIQRNKRGKRTKDTLKSKHVEANVCRLSDTKPLASGAMGTWQLK